MIRALLLLPLLATCPGDETLTAYGASQKTWVLTEVNGSPAPATLQLTFPEPGMLVGTAPCNTFRAAVTAPYPWFAIGPILSTRRSCPQLANEAAFFKLLAAMELAETLGDTMLLSNSAGSVLVFTSGG